LDLGCKVFGKTKSPTKTDFYNLRQTNSGIRLLEVNGITRDALPGDLRLPPSRVGGADPWKLHQQIRQFGSSIAGMPAIFVYEDPDGFLEIIDGVTRATRIAKLDPQQQVPVVIIGRYRRSRSNSPAVRDRL
jgi:hypothetical protein